MNAEEPSAFRANGLRRWLTVLLIVASLLIARFLLAPTNYTSSVPLYFLYELPVGWWGFIKRTTPEIRLEPSAIILAALSFLVALALTHTIGRHFSRAWGWRSSMAASLAPILLFAITIGAAGIQMRITQLLTDKRSIESSNLVEYFAWLNIEIEMNARKKEGGAPRPVR